MGYGGLSDPQPITRPYVDDRPQFGRFAWAVVMTRGGWFGVYLDRDRALEAARNVDGVLVQLPVIADFRPQYESTATDG
jgi:hypothetical protein